MTMQQRAVDLKKEMEIKISQAKLKELYKKNYVTKKKITKTAQAPNPTAAKMLTQKKNIEFA